MSLTIKVLGEFSVSYKGEALRLPSSKRSRALLAYLAVTAIPHRRDRLCEVFWKIPDDPRGALRWSLSKLRPLVNTSEKSRLVADRERVYLDVQDIQIDLKTLQSDCLCQDLPIQSLIQLTKELDAPFLEDTELPDQALYQRWLTSERQENKRLLCIILAKLSAHRELNNVQRLEWARQWQRTDPFNTDAASCLLTLLEKLSLSDEFDKLSQTFTEKFAKADISWPAVEQKQTAAQTHEDARTFLAKQKIEFCTTQDDVRIAYASIGEGYPIVKAANWFSHLELEWDAPIWSEMFKGLALNHRFIRYDERGNGLSDWDVDDISFEAFVQDLEAVVNTNNLDEFVLLGISQGAAVSIEYAIRHPERVKKLILFGAYAQGWRHTATPQQAQEREAVMTLTEIGWGQDNPAYRQIFSSTFMPSANTQEHAWFNEFQRLTTSPQNAVRFLSVFSDIDVLAQLKKLKVPTLVIHSIGDLRIPVEIGREIASTIPNAKFVGLESDGHLLLNREDASAAFIENVEDFLKK